MPKSVIFVDSRVANYQSLIDSLNEPAEVFVLDGAPDGLAQMAAYLHEQTGIDAIHVISHGIQRALYFGGINVLTPMVTASGEVLCTQRS